MGYNPTTWESGDVISSAKLNNIEQGIANAGAMIVHNNDDTLDKTWQEIHDAAPFVWLFDGENYAPLVAINSVENNYFGSFFDARSTIAYNFTSSSADGYPTVQIE